MQRTPVQHEDGPKKELLDCCDKDTEDDQACCPIKIPSHDFFYGKEGRPRKHLHFTHSVEITKIYFHTFFSGCIPFIRSRRVKPTGLDCDRAEDVENAATSWIDLSFLYGSDTETAL